MTIERYESVKYRASYPVYLAYKINKAELWFLCQLSGVIQATGREYVSKKIFFDSLTGNNKMKVSLHGPFYGLLDRGFIGTFEYVGRPGSVCLGISELGYNALRMYHSHIERIAGQIKPVKQVMKRKYRAIELPRNK